jgi:hypothetical protein
MSETITLGPHFTLFEVLLNTFIAAIIVTIVHYLLFKKGRVNKEENGVES